MGYKIYDENNNEIKRDIEIISNLDINMVGDYEIKYKFGKIELIRNIIVLEKPSEYYNIKLNEVDGEETIYLRLNDEYSEPGYKILDHNGSDVTDKIEVKIEEKIDTTQKGNYVVIYEFTDLNN